MIRDRLLLLLLGLSAGIAMNCGHTLAFGSAEDQTFLD